MASFKDDALVQFNLESELAANYKVTNSKCGEIVFSYGASGHFELYCSYCEQKYVKIKPFAKHILTDHLYCHEDHLIDYLINDTLGLDFDLKNKNNTFNNETHKKQEGLLEVNLTNFIDVADDSIQLDSKEDIIIDLKDNVSESDTYGEKNNSSDDEVLINKKYNNRKRKKSAKSEPFECSICNMKFIRKHNLRRHIQNKHNSLNRIENNINKEKSSNTTEKTVLAVRKDLKKLICYICGKETSKSDMRQHLKSHDNSRYTHKCNDCGKLFISVKSLELHNRNFHINIKPFNCKFDNCNKSFVSEHALTAHHRLHTDTRTFKCPICKKGFLYKYKMDHHIKIYHVNGRSYKCDVCGKSYYESYTLERHKICHSNEKPFACDLCPARFPRERSLDWHKQSHTGIKDYKCKICGKEYALYNGIYSHMKTHGIKYSLAYEKGLVQPEIFKKNGDLDNKDI